MTKEEKTKQYSKKPYILCCNGEFVDFFPSHKAAKLELHRRCELMKKYPWDYADEYYTIEPYNK